MHDDLHDDLQALTIRLTAVERRVAVWRGLALVTLLVAFAAAASPFRSGDTTVTADRVILRGAGSRTVSLTLSQRGGVQLDFSGGMRGPTGASAEITILDDGNEVARLGGAMARNAHP